MTGMHHGSSTAHPGHARSSGILAALLLIGTGLVQTAIAAPAIRGLAQVVDGDSLEIAGRRIRLWGVDAVEFNQTCERDRRSWKCGTAATRALRKRLDDHSTSCVVVETDQFGRAVSRCETDGASVNEWLVREGWALDYGRYSGGRYAQAQNEAKKARRGIWAGSFETPEQWRRRQSK